MKHAARTVVVFVCLISLTAALAAERQAATAKSTPKRQPSLSVKSDGERLILTNKSRETYRKLTLRLVIGLDFNSYMASLKDLGPGKSMLVNLRDVTTNSGVRFNPRKYKAMTIIEGHYQDGTEWTWGGR